MRHETEKQLATKEGNPERFDTDQYSCASHPQRRENLKALKLNDILTHLAQIVQVSACHAVVPGHRIEAFFQS